MFYRTSWIIGLSWAAWLMLTACRPAATPAAPPTPTALSPMVGTALPARSGSSPIPAQPTVALMPTDTPAPSPTAMVNSLAVGATGIRIVAQLGPTCPGPERPGEVCTRPYQGEFVITGQGGVDVARASTDENGVATVNVPPGTYTVTLHLDSQKPYPRGAPLVVTVPPNQVVEAAFNLDTGIR